MNTRKYSLPYYLAMIVVLLIALGMTGKGLLGLHLSETRSTSDAKPDPITQRERHGKLVDSIATMHAYGGNIVQNPIYHGARWDH